MIKGNEWYEKGELPPVGATVKIRDNGSLVYGQGESGEVIGHIENCAIVRVSFGLGCFERDVLIPIQPERDKLINKMEFDVRGEEFFTSEFKEDIFGTLIDAGWRPSND